MFTDDYRDQPIEQPEGDMRSPCGHEKDSYGFCPCDGRAVVCQACDTVIKQGYGLPQWEAGDDSFVDVIDCEHCR